MKTSELERVIYYQDYVITDPGDTPLKPRELLSEEEYLRARDKYGDTFMAEMGADAVRTLLNRLDLAKEVAEMRMELDKTNSQQKKKDLAKRLKIVESLRLSGNTPEWMIMEVVPVIPPDLRPLVLLESGNFRHQRPERSVPPHHQPQQPAQEAGGPQCSRGDHPQ